MMRWQPSDGIHLVFLLLYEVVVDVLLVWHELVNRAAGCEFDDTVAYGLNELVVVAGEQNVALEGDKVVVQCLDRLQVEMVGRRVEDETVGILQLHAGNHQTHLHHRRARLPFSPHPPGGKACGQGRISSPLRCPDHIATAIPQGSSRC